MTFYFYDLETSGFDARRARIMQFAGQRTDINLKSIGKPDNLLVKITPDILPDPDAVMIHGITPQKTIAEGMSEAEFTKYLTSQVFSADTIAIGYNNIRFDDEFIRFTFWRNFTDAYEWAWKDGRSRWDLLDVVRMTRALQPDGIQWPFAPDGKPSNRLEYLSTINKLDYAEAHDALSDVKATIALARLVRSTHGKLFDYLFKLRKKAAIKPIVESGKPFMYTSGRYPSEFLHTTAAVMLGRHAQQDYILVYDLRYDPEPFLEMSVDQLVEAWKWSADPDKVRLPVKTLKYNRCPAVLPGVVKDSETLERLSLSREEVSANLAKVAKSGQKFTTKLFEAVEKMDQERDKKQISMIGSPLEVDCQLYDNFISGVDKTKMSVVRAAQPDELSKLDLDFSDERLRLLLPLYKARNYPKLLNSDEQKKWQDFCRHKLLDGGADSRSTNFFKRLEEVSQRIGLTAEQNYLLEELQLYAQSVLPEV